MALVTDIIHVILRPITGLGSNASLYRMSLLRVCDVTAAGLAMALQVNHFLQHCQLLGSFPKIPDNPFIVYAAD